MRLLKRADIKKHYLGPAKQEETPEEPRDTSETVEEPEESESLKRQREKMKPRNQTNLTVALRVKSLVNLA